MVLPHLHGADELRGDLRDNGVAVGAQSSHAAGYPMSQRENAGANEPNFPVFSLMAFANVP
jgi:hypothetical protein